MSKALSGSTVFQALVSRVATVEGLAAVATPFALTAYGASASNAAAANDAVIASTISQYRLSRLPFDVGSSMLPISQSISFDLANYPDDGLIIQGKGWAEGAVARSSGFYVSSSLAGPAVNLDATTNTDAPIILRDFALQNVTGDPKQGSVTSDGVGGRSNSLILDRVMVRYFHGHGVDLDLSFSCATRDNLIFGNFGSGINLTRAFNRVQLQNDRLFYNGRNFATDDQGNIRFNGSGNVGYGPSLVNCDVSFCGYSAWSYSAGTLSSVVVSGGTATITTATAHGLSTGNMISVKRSGISGLDTRYSATVTSINPTTFSVSTSAANGPYNAVAAPNISIGPHSNGITWNSVHGGLIDVLYCESPQGLAAYFNSCKSITIRGGFVLNGEVVIENCSDFLVSGIEFDGTSGQAGLVTNEIDHRATINVTGCTFSNGATFTHGNYFMRDGLRYGNAVPTTGTWSVGEICWNSTPSVGQPKGWVCTTAPTTFTSLGNL